MLICNIIHHGITATNAHLTHGANFARGLLTHGRTSHDKDPTRFNNVGRLSDQFRVSSNLLLSVSLQEHSTLIQRLSFSLTYLYIHLTISTIFISEKYVIVRPHLSKDAVMELHFTRCIIPRSSELLHRKLLIRSCKILCACTRRILTKTAQVGNEMRMDLIKSRGDELFIQITLI